MPNRLIRDEMLESEAILSLPVEARWFYVTILLSADDIGLFEATSFRLARRADVRREAGDKLLEMLADADLIRLYEVEGKRYGFIPKFRQRLQIKRSKHPVPPLGLLNGDEDAINKIKDLGSKTTVENRGSPLATVAQPPEPEPEPELEIKNTNTRKRTPAAVAAPPEGVSPSVWEDFLQLRKVKKAPMTNAALAGLIREAEKANWTLEQAISECCARGWTGFKADWVAQRQAASTMTVPSKQERDPVLVKLEQDAAKKAPPPPEVLSRIQSILRKVP